MYCDALTLAAVADELRARVLGGRIQRVVTVDRLAIGLELYAHGQRQYLLVSAQPELGGHVHLVPYKLRRGPPQASPFLLRLHKCSRGARLTDIRQPAGERILQLTIEGVEASVSLIAEVMGRRSNIILVEEDSTILECVRHVPASQNRYRVLLPGQPYLPPPAQKKAEADTLTPGRLETLLQQDATKPLWQRLVSSIRGVSPLLAREVVYRATGDVASHDLPAQAVWEHLLELLSLPATGNWQPTVALERGEVVAFAPYRLSHYPHHDLRDSISEAMDMYYAGQAGRDAYAVQRQRVEDIIASQRARQLRKREALLRAQPAADRVAGLRHKGELLLAYASQVSPGQSELIVNLREGEPSVHITLAPSRSAIENAQQYFRQYEKAKSAAVEVPKRLSEVDQELAYLDQLSTDLVLAVDQPGIAAVESSLVQAGYTPKGKKPRAPRVPPLRLVSDDGFVIWVGRNSGQNEELTFRRSRSDDLWLHAQGAPGAHVIVHTNGETVPERTLVQAAQLAAFYSRARGEKSVRVDYALRRHVRRAVGGRPGQVVYKNQRTVVVQPQE